MVQVFLKLLPRSKEFPMKRFLSSLLSWCKSSPRRPVPCRGRSARLGLEALEERQLMSASPTHWVIEQQPANIVAGSPITVKVEAENAAGQVVVLNSGQMSLALANDPTGGALSGNLTLSEASNGVITMSGMTINQSGSNYSLKVSGSGNGITLTPATTSSFSVAPGSPGTLTWTGAGHDQLWSDPRNWSLDRAPITGDTLIFPSGAYYSAPNQEGAGGAGLASFNNISPNTLKSLAAVDIAGSNIGVMVGDISIGTIDLAGSGDTLALDNNAFGPQLTIGSIYYYGANDTVTGAAPGTGPAHTVTLTGSIVDDGPAGSINNLCVCFNLAGNHTMTVDSGAYLYDHVSGIDYNSAFYGSGSLTIYGPGQVFYSSEEYNAVPTVVKSGALDIYKTNAPWGPLSGNVKYVTMAPW